MNYRKFFILGLVILQLSACQSQPKLQWETEGVSRQSLQELELALVRPDYIQGNYFIAVTEVNGQKLRRPWIFGYDTVELPLGTYELKLELGHWLEPNIKDYAEDLLAWDTEIGTINIRELSSSKGKYFLVGSYDEMYLSNTREVGYLQRWHVSFPRDPSQGSNWSVEEINLEAPAAEGKGTEG